jgi:hypothetical protein
MSWRARVSWCVCERGIKRKIGREREGEREGEIERGRGGARERDR